jgi:hypothetical protein
MYLILIEFQFVDHVCNGVADFLFLPTKPTRNIDQHDDRTSDGPMTRTTHTSFTIRAKSVQSTEFATALRVIKIALSTCKQPTPSTNCIVDQAATASTSRSTYIVEVGLDQCCFVLLQLHCLRQVFNALVLVDLDLFEFLGNNVLLCNEPSSK